MEQQKIATDHLKCFGHQFNIVSPRPLLKILFMNKSSATACKNLINFLSENWNDSATDYEKI